MRLPDTPTVAGALPLWPPLLATRGQGSASAPHAHHAMHLVLALSGELGVRSGARGRWQRAAGVLTAPDVPHAIDAAGAEILLVFIDPESAAGAALSAVLGSPIRLLEPDERARLVEGADPLAIMQREGTTWTAHAVSVLGGPSIPQERKVHPRVRRLLAHLASDGAMAADTSLEALAAGVGLSPGRLMHVFTESIGVPLRPYLSWLRIQRAAAAIVGGASMARAAHAAGFSDAAHMTRTFKRTFGMPPSALRRAR